MLKDLIERIKFYYRARQKMKEITRHLLLVRPPYITRDMLNVKIIKDKVVLLFPRLRPELVLGKEQAQLLLDALIKFEERL